jgi:D-3-phosphoglycerate dehydrogenase
VVTGTLFGGKHPRIVGIKGIEIEAEFAPHMLYDAAGREQGQHCDLPSRPRCPAARRSALIQVDQPVSPDGQDHGPRGVVQAKLLSF